MNRNLIIILFCVFLCSCGRSYEEQRRISRAERARLQKEDSLALKVGTLPTLDCLPLFVAYERKFFERLGEDIRVKPYQSQIDCDDALLKKKIEGNVTDVVRAQRMKHRGLRNCRSGACLREPQRECPGPVLYRADCTGR